MIFDLEKLNLFLKLKTHGTQQLAHIDKKFSKTNLPHTPIELNPSSPVLSIPKAKRKSQCHSHMALIELLNFYWISLGSPLCLYLSLLGWFETKSNYFKFLKIKVTIVSLWRNKSDNYIFMVKLTFTCVCVKLCASVLFFTHFLY